MEKSRFVLRKAGIEDIPDLSLIFREAVAGNTGDYTPAQLSAWIGRGTPDRWNELFADGLRFVLALCGDIPAGFASASSDGYLHSLFVRPCFQRKGAATLLLSDAERYIFAGGNAQVTSDVSLTARLFFERNGFRIERTETVYLEGEKLLRFVMQKDRNIR